MRTRRTFVASLALALLGLALVAVPAEAGSGDCGTGAPIVLCGVTTISGERGSVLVEVAEEFRRFVLDPVDPLKEELAAFRFPSEMHDGDGDLRAYGSWNFLNPPGDPYDVIPAGTYRLHVFSEDNQPVDIELRLDGLDGRVDLAPTTTASTKVVRLNPTLPTPDEGIEPPWV